MKANNELLLDIKGLTMEYVTYSGLFGRHKQRIRVLHGLDLQIFKGETLGIVGESGCGKSTLGHSIMRFIKPTAGEVIYAGSDILKRNKKELRTLRRQMQMVFQNPHASLNPRMRIFDVVAEPLRTHTKMNRQEMEGRVVELLLEMGLSGEYKNRYPHQISDGQAQRVVLARALALNPSFLVLDEPTSALDVSVQAQIINLLLKLQKEHKLTYMFISHDLSVVQHISDRIGVMYLGQIVELADSQAIFCNPQHPYTQALLSATPVPDPDDQTEQIILQGNVPSPANPPSGCRFHTRCPVVMDKCRTEPPPAYGANRHWATCHLLKKGFPNDNPTQRKETSGDYQHFIRF